MKDIGIIYLVEDPIDRFPGQTPAGFVGRVPRRFREVFTFSARPTEFTGIHKLAQVVSKVILTKSGSDRYSPRMGGGIEDLAGSPVSQEEVSGIQRDISVMLSVVEEQIIRAQRDQQLEFDERLQELDLITANFDFGTGKWDIRIRLVSEAGSTVALNLPVVTLGGS